MAGSPLVLPGWAADLLNELGYIWPKSDEVQMFDLGSAWVDFGGEAHTTHGRTNEPVQAVTTQNTGGDIDAFTAQWNHRDHGSEVLKDGSQGATLVGPGLYIAAGLVLALKIAVIVQVTLLIIQIIQAIAASVATLGVSLLWIPVAKKLAGLAINLALSQVIEALLG
ncbi:WXG100-like domain-containing protein [Actinopolymorpha pittospori]